MVWACLPASLLAGGAPAREARDSAPGVLEREVGEIAKASKALGQCPRTYSTDHFLLVYGAHHPYAAQAGRLLERTHEEFYLAFERAGFRPRALQSRLTWVIFARHDDFDDYAREADRMDMSRLDGYYSARTNRVAVVQRSACVRSPAVAPSVPTTAFEPILAGFAIALAPAGGTAACGHVLDIEQSRHEATHQLAFNSGLQKRGVMYPLWVSEGLATYCETEQPISTAGKRESLGRRQVLLEAYTRGRLARLTDFVALTRLADGDDGLTAGEVYAQAWGLFRFLCEDHRDELRGYLAALAQLPTGRRDERELRSEFVTAFGPIAPLQESWTLFLRRLAASPLCAAPGTPTLPDVAALAHDQR